MYQFPSFRSSQLLFLIAFLFTGYQAFPQCESLPEPSFHSHSWISGSWGAVNSVYRYTNVLPGTDALISIIDRQNTSLWSMDLTSTGAGGNWQPQVYLNWQSNIGNTGYMDFRVQFVGAGTYEPLEISEILITAMDIDGDGYRLREAVGFSSVNTFELDNPTHLFSYEVDGYTMFEASTVWNEEGINTVASDHMVSVTATDVTSFVVRCHVAADPSNLGWSNAADRMFSFSFDPCMAENYVVPNSFPVEMGEFAGQLRQGHVDLSWTTFSELNNDRFEIEKSEDGRAFIQLGQVAGHGTTEAPQQYSFMDNNPVFGKNYYRLRQVDFDGQFQYSSTIEVDVSSLEKSIRVWPNPAKEQLHLDIPVGKRLTAIEFLNVSGQSWELETHGQEEGEVTLSLSDNLPTGVYLLRTQLDGIWQKGEAVVIE